jgi:hypothetical protein
LKEGLVFAPGEGIKPLSLVNDTDVEELSFPTIYWGKRRNFKNKLSYADIVKSELMRFDRRCCTILKIFFMYKKKETLAIKDALNLCMR